MEDGQHGLSGGFINELRHEVPQGDAIAGELDLILHLDLQEGDRIAIGELHTAELLGAADVLARCGDVLGDLKKMKAAGGEDVLQNDAPRSAAISGTELGAEVDGHD